MANGSERYKKGSLPPFLSLGDAIILVEEIYAQAGGKANYNVLSRIFDNSPSSSSFTKKIACLKTYGLVSESVKGEVSLSDTGLAIAAPQSSEDGFAAKKDALLRVDVFNRIFERHKGKLVPADEFLKNIIEQDCHIPRELSDAWVASFKDSFRVAGLLYDRGDQKTQIMEAALVPRPSVAPAPNPERSEQSVSATHSIDASIKPSPPELVSSSGLNISIRLSGGQVATFRIPDKLTSKDAQKLKGTLEGFGSMIESLVGEEET